MQGNVWSNITCIYSQSRASKEVSEIHHMYLLMVTCNKIMDWLVASVTVYLLTHFQNPFTLPLTTVSCSLQGPTEPWVNPTDYLRTHRISLAHIVHLRSHQGLDTDDICQWMSTISLTKTSNCYWYGDCLVVVDNLPLKRGVISLYHDSPMAGHPGITKTTQLINVDYWWR